MLGRVLLLVLPSVVLCFDAVLWSSENAINRKSPPALSTLMESATVEKPLVLFLMKEFQLSDFSRHANVYGAPSKATKGLKKWIAESKGYAAEWLDETTQLPAGLFVEYNGELTELSEQPVVVVRVGSFADIDDLVDNVLQSLDRPYTAVLAGAEAVTTHAIKKRITINDGGRGEVRADTKLSNPGDAIVFPRPPLLNSSTCLLYIKKVGLQVFLPNARTETKLSNMWLNNATYDIDAPSFCLNFSDALKSNLTGNATNSFTITLTPMSGNGNGDFTVENLSFRLNVMRTYTGYWSLSSIDKVEFSLSYNTSKTAKYLDPVTVDNNPIRVGAKIKSISNSTAQARRWGITSVDSFSFACSITPPAWIIGLEVDNNGGATPSIIPQNNPKDVNMIQVGIVLSGLQLQAFTVRGGRFSRNVDDCVPTFSEGSWMGIIVGLIFLFAFLFAMTMLNGVQTMDRFDDPKQKQIVINFKE